LARFRSKKEKSTQCDTETYRTKIINKIYFMEDGDKLSIKDIAGSCQCSDEQVLETLNTLIEQKRIDGTIDTEALQFTVKK